MRGKRIYIVLIIVSTLVITYPHYSILGGLSPNVVLEELYYIPLLLGALVFGLKGALLTYLYISACYFPFFFGQWTTSLLGLLDRALHLLFSGIFAFIAGFLVDWDRKRQKRFEKDRYLAGLGEVAMTIVHDLRNPLISILGFANRIREKKGDLNTAVETIIDAAKNMQRMVEGALDFARPMKLELKEEDILSVVRQACDSCDIKAEDREIVLSPDLPAGPVHISLDHLYLQRAIINLINNAMEASAKGQRVDIRVETRENQAVIKVKDFGSGMDQETLENIFLPFYSKKSSGTGLGMAIVKKVVEAHQGSIHIESHPGRGTEVGVE